MTAELAAFCFDADDPERLAAFWGAFFDRPVGQDDEGVPTLPPVDGAVFALRFRPADRPKSRPNQVHFDLPSASYEDQQAAVERALSLGARHIDVGQLPEEEHVVLADPEGNEMCVIEPGNGFLAGTGVIGALSSDGSRQVGHFWSRALGWPLVWDQDEETAIQAPAGGTKISWGGPPVAPKPDKNRLHLDLAVARRDLPAELDRLLGLGARHADVGQGEVDWVVLADPDGNEFCLKPRD